MEQWGSCSLFLLIVSVFRRSAEGQEEGCLGWDFGWEENVVKDLWFSVLSCCNRNRRPNSKEKEEEEL